MDDLYTLIAGLRGDMNRQFTEVRGQYTELRGDMDCQFTEVRADMNRQFTELRADMNRRFEQVESRSQALDMKVDRHFTWVVGIQVALMLAIIGAMAGAYYR